ncbi:MAG: flagellar biosynthetic protein FliR [Thermodesulfobacteriota bacterium]
MDALALVWGRMPYFSLVLIRTGALLFSLPMFGARGVPVPLKVGMAVAFSWALLPILPLPDRAAPQEVLEWGLVAIREAAIGLAIGWMVHLVLAAVPLAGHVLGYQMGFGLANLMDPVGQQQLSMSAHFLNLMALWLFFVMDGHHLLVTVLFESFRWSPPVGLADGAWMGALGAEAGRTLFWNTLVLAGPLLLVLLLLEVALGIMARVVPQMNVFIVAGPVQIAIGLLGLGAGLGLMAPWMLKELSWLRQLYGLLGG